MAKEMATPYRKDARGAASDTRRAAPTGSGGRAPQAAGLAVIAFKCFAGSLGVAFGTGVAIGIFQSLRGTRGGAGEIADFASLAVNRVFNAPAEWAIGMFDLSNRAADLMLGIISYAGVPYEAVAYAGGYAGSTVVQIAQSLVPAWSFHF